MSARGSALRGDDGRLRAWLRILLVVVAVVVADAATSVVALVFDAFAAQRAASGLVGGLMGVGLVVVFIRRLDRRGVSGYGLRFDRGWWLDLAAGGDADVVLLDVREETEYETVDLGGKLLPLAAPGDRLDVHRPAGRWGATAVQQLQEVGFVDAWKLNGALASWQERIDRALPAY